LKVTEVDLSCELCKPTLKNAYRYLKQQGLGDTKQVLIYVCGPENFALTVSYWCRNRFFGGALEKKESAKTSFSVGNKKLFAWKTASV